MNQATFESIVIIINNTAQCLIGCKSLLNTHGIIKRTSCQSHDNILLKR